MVAGLAAEYGAEMTVVIDATHLKAPSAANTMASKRGAWPESLPDRGIAQQCLEKEGAPKAG